MTIDFHRTKKIQIPPVSIDGIELEQVSSFRLLGVNITNDLKWKEHTDSMCSKANTRIYFLKRLRRSGLTTEELIKYYITYIRPVVEYACQAWHGSLTGGQCRQVEQIQKRSLRIIHPDMTYDDALASCKLVSLEDRRESLCKKLFNQIRDSNHKLNYLVPIIEERPPVKYNLRHPRQEQTIKCRTGRAEHSFIYHCAKNYLF